MSQPLGDPVLCYGDPLWWSRHIDFPFSIQRCHFEIGARVFYNVLCKLKPTFSWMSKLICDLEIRARVFYNVLCKLKPTFSWMSQLICDLEIPAAVFYNDLCKLKPTFSWMSQLTLQPRLWLWRCGCDFWKSPFDSSVNSAHRLLSLSRSGSVAVSSRATVLWTRHIDFRHSRVLAQLLFRHVQQSRSWWGSTFQNWWFFDVDVSQL